MAAGSAVQAHAVLPAATGGMHGACRSLHDVQLDCKMSAMSIRLLKFEPLNISNLQLRSVKTCTYLRLNMLINACVWFFVQQIAVRFTRLAVSRGLDYSCTTFHIG